MQTLCRKLHKCPECLHCGQALKKLDAHATILKTSPRRLKIFMTLCPGLKGLKSHDVSDPARDILRVGPRTTEAHCDVMAWL